MTTSEFTTPSAQPTLVATVDRFGYATPTHAVREFHRYRGRKSSLFAGYVTECGRLIAITERHVTAIRQPATCAECQK